MSDELNSENQNQDIAPTSDTSVPKRVNVFNQQEGHDVQELHPRSEIHGVVTTVTTSVQGSNPLDAKTRGNNGGFGG